MSTFIIQESADEGIMDNSEYPLEFAGSHELWPETGTGYDALRYTLKTLGWSSRSLSSSISTEEAVTSTGYSQSIMVRVGFY